VLRRTKREVAGDLPDRIELDHWLDLDDDARALYRDVAAAGLNRWEELNDEGQSGAASLHLLTVILRLRQICLDRRLVDPEAGASQRGVKSEWLETLLEERSDEGEKTLVFSQFTTFLRNLKNREDERFGRLFLLDGATRDRSAVVREFQHHDGPAAFLISLKAGGYGLNLTAADAVVHMDPWWNPAVEAQASDRAHRIGQDRPVTIHRLLVRDSVEERVRRLQAAKRSLVAEIHGDAPPSDWKTDDLRSLLE
jgi:SNF2 family DNA or RNA helicase